MSTIVVGLGNPLLSDDGVGVIVAYEVIQSLSPELRNIVHVTEACVGGIRLMELLVGYERAIIIDALTMKNGSTPGTIHKMSLDDLKEISPTQHSCSAHDTSLITALDLGRHLGYSLPDEIVIYAVEVENVMDFSETPTPLVAEAIPRLKSMVMDEINRILQS
jgi:hydrogenase maturation protease